MQRAVQALTRAKTNRALMIDCSHDNSQKDHARQPQVLAAVGEQLRATDASILGVMLESNLVAGRQELQPGAQLVYGQSITDACLDFAATERALERFAAEVASGQTRRISA